MIKSSVILLLLVFVLGACAPAPAQVTNTEIPEAEATLPEPETQATLIEPEGESLSWTDYELIDAQTREPFTLADFEGKTVYVHLMATWCSNCRASQQRLQREIIPQFGDDVVFLSLDVQYQLEASDLEQYAEENAFDWKFAVTTLEFMNDVAAYYGRAASNPPSTPHFVVYPDGRVSPLQTGSTTVEQELALIRGEV